MNNKARAIQVERGELKPADQSSFAAALPEEARGVQCRSIAAVQLVYCDFCKTRVIQLEGGGGVVKITDQSSFAAALPEEAREVQCPVHCRIICM